MKKIGTTKVVHTNLPNTSDAGVLEPRPVAVQERRLIKKDNLSAVMVLIEWENGPP